MSPVSTPTLILPREEWPDADFDLPEGALLHTVIDKDDDDDWDMGMDLGQTGGAKATTNLVAPLNRSEFSSYASDINIRPPLHRPDFDDEDEGEGVSTIKALSATFKSNYLPKPQVEVIEEDFEDAFALPTDLTQLSLAPLSLSHRASKNSLEWGDKEHSSSSQSSDAYSSLGFANASPSSNSTSSPSLPDTETEEDEDDLEGLVLPPALFESGQSARHLKRILETKKTTLVATNPVKVSEPDPEDDFEMGLIINDDVDLSPSRLVSSTQKKIQRSSTRSDSIPPQCPSSLRPPSRPKLERSKSPANPPTSSLRQLQKLRLSPSPPLRPPSRSQHFQPLVSSLPTSTPSPSSSQSFLSPKPGSLRGQKSHSGLKPPTPPASTRKLTRKASMSSLIESSLLQPSVPDHSLKFSRYEEPTAASRAKTHKSSTSRISDYKASNARPSTPSSNSAALRTMPTQSRLRSRPALSQVFSGSSSHAQDQSSSRAVSPLPPRPPSSLSLRASVPPRNTTLSPAVPKLLRRPKRLRTYGDGTELDGFEDLPTDREKEVRYRVQPKGYGNRIPGSSFSSKAGERDKSSDKVAHTSKKGRHDVSLIRGGSSSPNQIVNGRLTLFHLEPSTNLLRRTTTRIEFPLVVPTTSEVLPKRKKHVSPPSSSTTKRKPTLIRNLGGATAPKVVGEMKWNPQTLRWEGNDQVLREFDAAVGTSTRPALITHLSGAAVGSPIGSIATGARIVGNMVFDPSQMCWISTLPPEEDEPDVFANLADDEDDSDAWESKGGTIRANFTRISDASATSMVADPRAEASSPTYSHSRTMSESGSERGSRASMVVCDVDDVFIQSCRKAEERHRSEMKGWKTTLSKRDTSLASDRSYLFEIRDLATRKY